MKCFVIMSFASEFDDVYSTIKASAKEAAGAGAMRCTRLDEIKRPGRISDDLIAAISSADLCIADLTGDNPNVMWETGYAMALRKPILFISQDVKALPFDIRDMRTIPYERFNLSGTLRPRLKESIEQTISTHPTSASAQETVDRLFSGDKLAHALVEGIPIPLFYKDASGVYRGCNSEFCEFLNRGPDKIIGKTVYDVSLPSKAAVYQQKDDELLKNPGKQIYETVVDAKDGPRTVRFLKGTFSADGQMAGLVGLILDVTDLRTAEQELRESEDRYKKLAEATGEGVVLHDGEHVIEVNETFLRMFGYERDTAVGSHPSAFVTAAAWPSVKAHIESGSEEVYDSDGRRRDGTVFKCRVRGLRVQLHGQDVRVAIISKR